MKNQNFRIGLIQMSCSPDPDTNLEKAVERVREAARQGAQVICLPELFRSVKILRSLTRQNPFLAPARRPSGRWHEKPR